MPQAIVRFIQDYQVPVIKVISRLYDHSIGAVYTK